MSYLVAGWMSCCPEQDEPSSPQARPPQPQYLQAFLHQCGFIFLRSVSIKVDSHSSLKGVKCLNKPCLYITQNSTEPRTIFILLSLRQIVLQNISPRFAGKFYIWLLQTAEQGLAPVTINQEEADLQGYFTWEGKTQITKRERERGSHYRGGREGW